MFVFQIYARKRVTTLGSDYKNYGHGRRTQPEATPDPCNNIPRRRRKPRHHPVDPLGRVSSGKKGSDSLSGIIDIDFDRKRAAFRGQVTEGQTTHKL